VALGLAAGFLSSVTQARGADAAMLDTGTWIALVGRTLWFHVVKTLLPVGLSAVYQLPVRVPLDDPTVLVSGAGVLAISLATVSLASRWPAGLAVWLVYGALLAPVMGLMHAGFQVTADRYGYLPCLGLSLLVGAAAGGLCRAGAAGRLRPAAGGLLLIAGLAGLGGLGVLTWRQTGVWRDNWTLWAHAVDAAPECALCRTNLGVELLARGGPAEALTQFRMALAVRPESARAHGNIGRALAALGRHAEAVPHYEIMLARYPRQVDVRTHLATTLLYLGRREEAVAQMRLAARAGDAPDATAYFGRVLAERPGSLAARLGLAEVHLAAGRIELARRELELIRAGDPPLAAILQSGLPAGSGPAR
jgi:Tfp pilus assembly protein PilF